jgi:hypothetical protein
LRVSGFRIAGTALHHKLYHVLGGSLRGSDLDRAADLAAERPTPTGFHRP